MKHKVRVRFNGILKIYSRSYFRYDSKYDTRHRIDGPAFEWTDGLVFYYINDMLLSKEEFNDIQNKNRKSKY